MTKKWTKERIADMACEKRLRLYTNAKALDTEEAAEVVKMIEESGLPFSEIGGIRMDDPLVQAIYQVVFSDEGKAAALEAAENDLPALAGVDPLLAEKFGVDYGKHNMTTHTAGAFIAELMRQSGYEDSGRQMEFPDGCVARSGVLWVKRV